MLSVVLTSKREPKTIGRAVDCIVDRAYSGISGDFEFITVVTDDETETSIKLALKKYKNVKWISLRDEAKGKPAALNKAFKIAKGESIFLTDGDVYLDKNAIGLLQKAINSNKDYGAVSGRPISLNSRNTLFGYYSHLLADAAHHKRKVTSSYDSGYSRIFIKKAPFVPISGYVYIMRNINLRLPEDCLADDGYISYAIYNKGFQIGYEQNAKVFVKFPTHLKDWMAQKLRSSGAFVQLWKYGVINEKTKVRNFWKELEYFWFPIRYAKSIKEFFWSLLLYPLRFYMWLKVYWERKVLNKDFSKTWTVIQSTK